MAERTLADVVVQLRCHGCRQKGRLTVHLCETARGAGLVGGTVRRGWALLLHDSMGGPGIEAAASE